MQEHLPTMPESQGRQAKVDDCVEYGASLLQPKGQAKDKHWCFSVILICILYRLISMTYNHTYTHDQDELNDGTILRVAQ